MFLWLGPLLHKLSNHALGDLSPVELDVLKTMAREKLGAEEGFVQELVVCAAISNCFRICHSKTPARVGL